MADNPRQAAGPLVVAAANPRYFTVASGDGAAGKAVYLTGSHIWNNLHDGLGPTPDNVEGHPFHAANNGNGIAITSIVDYQVLPLDPRVQALQEAYIRQVVDTVHDLPNVLYEVANESSGDPTNPEVGDSSEWQYWGSGLVRKKSGSGATTSTPSG